MTTNHLIATTKSCDHLMVTFTHREVTILEINLSVYGLLRNFALRVKRTFGYNFVYISYLFIINIFIYRITVSVGLRAAGYCSELSVKRASFVQVLLTIHNSSLIADGYSLFYELAELLHRRTGNIHCAS